MQIYRQATDADLRMPSGNRPWSASLAWASLTSAMASNLVEAGLRTSLLLGTSVNTPLAGVFDRILATRRPETRRG